MPGQAPGTQAVENLDGAFVPWGPSAPALSSPFAPPNFPGAPLKSSKRDEAALLKPTSTLSKLAVMLPSRSPAAEAVDDARARLREEESRWRSRAAWRSSPAQVGVGGEIRSGVDGARHSGDAEAASREGPGEDPGGLVERQRHRTSCRNAAGAFAEFGSLFCAGP